MRYVVMVMAMTMILVIVLMMVMVLIMVMVIMTLTLMVINQVASGELDPKAKSFQIHVLDPFFCKPYSHFGQPGQLKKTSRLLLEFFQVVPQTQQ